jgi:hypothetical protein
MSTKLCLLVSSISLFVERDCWQNMIEFPKILKAIDFILKIDIGLCNE